jgi:hypothetical protein
MTSLQVYTRGHATGRPSRRERDFMLQNIFVMAQQGYIDRAGVLAEALGQPWRALRSLIASIRWSGLEATS